MARLTAEQTSAMASILDILNLKLINNIVNSIQAYRDRSGSVMQWTKIKTSEGYHIRLNSISSSLFKIRCHPTKKPKLRTFLAYV
jgi:hypothetical protein